MRDFGHCVGIAAPQIGELVRVAVVDVSGHPKAESSNGELVLVNPRVVEGSGFDHLDGILFLDRVASIVDDVFRRRSYGGEARG